MTDHLPRMLFIQGTAPVAVEDNLLHQDVVSMRVPGTVSSGKVWACGLRDGETAFYKPLGAMDTPHPHLGYPVYAAYGHHDAPAVAVNEAAAWRLAHGLGAPFDTLVATSVIRWVHGQPGIPGDWGSFTRKGAGPSAADEPLQDADLRDVCAFFDALVGQQDRHTGNYRFEAGVLTLIDHGFCFPGGQWLFNQSVFLEHRHAANAAALSDDERFILEQLPSYAAWAELGLVLRDDQMAALEARRREMLDRDEVLKPSSSDLCP